MYISIYNTSLKHSHQSLFIIQMHVTACLVTELTDRTRRGTAGLVIGCSSIFKVNKHCLK